MRKEQLPMYAVALAVLIVGLAAIGVPLASLLIVPLILVCPLLMMFMMRGMVHGGTTHSPGTGRDGGQDADSSNR